MHRIAVAVLFATVVGCASTPTEMPPPTAGAPRYSAEAGPSPVGAIPDVVLHDTLSGRDVVVSIDYPTRGEKNPVIVFSHGFGGSNRGYAGLSSHWASNGYVVIRPRHADSGKLREIDSLEEIWASQSPSDWARRAADVRFVLDSLAGLEERFPELQGKIDATRIGVGGHSYGAQTALLVGGATTGPAISGTRDERVRAVMAMSPQGPAPKSGFHAESYRSLGLPVLFMTGSRDRGTSEAEGPEWRRQAFDLASPGEKWFISIEGARHSSFSGRLEDVIDRRRVAERSIETDAWGRPVIVEQDERNQRNPRGLWTRERDIFFAVRSLSLAFWDLYLRADEGGRKELNEASRRSGLVVVTK